jgi:hypothetical protein
MKKILFTIILLSFLSITMAQNNNREAIETILIKSYINAVFINFNEEAIREGFHKDFQFHFPIMTPNGSTTKKVELEEWIKMVSSMQFWGIESKIIEVYESGNAATTVSEIYQDGTKLYTDYMIWRKVDDKWMIMGKTFDMHQK